MFRISLNEACRLISLQVYEKYKDQITLGDVIRVSVVFWNPALLFPSVRHYEHKTSEDICHKRKQIFNSRDYTYINCSAKIRN